jgi:Putative transposase
MALSAEEFIRRFLLYVLPHGFHRIRYCGFLGNRFRQENLARCRQLLGMTVPQVTLKRSADSDSMTCAKNSPGHHCAHVRFVTLAIWQSWNC